MGEPLSINYSQLETLLKNMSEFSHITKRAVNDVLHADSTADYPINKIIPLIPSSGRKWKGKKTPASSTNPLRSDTSELLTLIIRSKKQYNYLYFPDDGSNTENHFGNQHFMSRGVDASMPKILELCQAQIIDEMNHLIK